MGIVLIVQTGISIGNYSRFLTFSLSPAGFMPAAPEIAPEIVNLPSRSVALKLPSCLLSLSLAASGLQEHEQAS